MIEKEKTPYEKGIIKGTKTQKAKDKKISEIYQEIANTLINIVTRIKW